jgi:hypothetical protein
MANARLTNAWLSYRREILRFYAVASPVLDGGTPLDAEGETQARAVLDAAYRRSRNLRRISQLLLFVRRSRDRKYDEIALGLVAAAAFDCMLAHDGLRVEREPVEPDPRYEDRASAVEAEQLDRLIAEADLLFGLPGEAPMAGAQNVDAQQLLAACTDALDQLITHAEDPVMRFGFGAVIATAGATVVAALNLLPGISTGAGLIRRRALDLLFEGMRKVIVAAGSESAVEQGLEFLRRPAANHAGSVVGFVGGRKAAGDRLARAFDPPAVWDDARVDRVGGEVVALTVAYENQMKWTARVAKWLSRLSPLICTLAPGGPAAVVALDGVGVGYVVYTLGVRLDGRQWLPSRVAGVGKIVERQ